MEDMRAKQIGWPRNHLSKPERICREVKINLLVLPHLSPQASEGARDSRTNKLHVK